MCRKTHQEENSEGNKKKDGDLVSESIGPKPQPKQKAQ